MNYNSGFRGEACQQNFQVAPAQRNAAGGGGEPWPGDMDKHGAAAASDAGSRVVVDFDNEIIKIVRAPQTVAWFTGRPPERPVIAPVGRVLAPGIQRPDSPNPQPCHGPRPPIRPPPQSERAKAATRRAPIAFALVSPDAGAAKRHRHGQRTGKQPALLAPSRPRADANKAQRRAAATAPLVLCRRFCV